MANESNLRRLRTSDESYTRNLASIATDQLRSDIVRCVFRPGEKLRVLALRERYGINASAIREALSRLVTDELVEAVEQKGFRVAPISYEDLRDLTETRIHIECMALTRAIEIGDPGWEGRVVAALHQVNRASLSGDAATSDARDAWESAHRNFHEALVAGCNSRWLVSFCRTLYEQTERYRNLAESRMRSNRKRNVDLEHSRIVAAALDRNVESACSRLKAHFLRTMNLILETENLAKGPAVATGRVNRRRQASRRPAP